MKTKTIIVKLDEETHRILKSEAVLAAQKLPDFASAVIKQALVNNKVFNK